jgi:hypothetical protein
VTTQDNKVRFIADTLTLDFTRKEDRSLAYSGDITELKGVVLNHN